MTRVPSLRELFERLAGESQDPHAALEAAGYGDLEPHLINEAIVNYAHGAPIEVAEHLSPFVIAHSGVPQGAEGVHETPDTVDGLSMLSSAPAEAELPGDHLDPNSGGHHDGHGVDHLDAAHTSALSLDHDPATHLPEPASAAHPGSEHADLSFGAGERGAEHTTAADADHGLHLPGDPAALPSTPGAEPGWLDVTGGDARPEFDVHHDDWTQGHHDHLGGPEVGHPGLDEHHDSGEELHGGAGA